MELAASEKETSDYTAVGVFAVAPGNNLPVLDGAGAGKVGTVTRPLQWTVRSVECALTLTRLGLRTRHA